MITCITKRDGRTRPFDIEKIANAIYKAAQAIGGARLPNLSRPGQPGSRGTRGAARRGRAFRGAGTGYRGKGADRKRHARARPRNSSSTVPNGPGSGK